MIGKGKRNDEFQTPEWLFNILNKRFSFTVDAASTQENKKTEKRFNNGLTESWSDHRVFCNPPFSQKKEWIKKADQEISRGGCDICVMILPTNSMSSSFWHDYIIGKYHYDIIKKRVQFIDPDTGKQASGADSGTTIVYFMKKIEVTNED